MDLAESKQYNNPFSMHNGLILLLQSYFGCAVGKAKQAAKTEIEKLKLADMTVKELVKEAARM